ncbi:Oxidoreductase, short-chain dehydrogenase/reductase family [Rasamsonia emersonii CBS 393.64]|uniref:Oxidoreductase, short-chain dehydrogenase/reductase family n=1 Tax=Rasamsonia emersonii (strain ATCC 16479 / CBS 393.64 / IMI 116815) TaxID=1408163 RepID=A0A0F4Z1Q2_RASE3|nr:Oxidoreductase, short-chain dehydrogenase/reductase family [Rasamsonia emersonii CBS 393.64]KKA24447.1 Oxidoreductase, short-chain dehydrogenase/reductase family [Rasamsonia emersonii CBS 393.64]
MSLAGRVVLITSASKGIGKAAAQRLAADGASVVVNYLTDAASASALVEQIGPDRALAVQADVSKVDEIRRLVEATVARFGRIDVVIANAGVLPVKDLDSTTEADFDAAFALNVKGPYFLVQQAARHMPAGGRVIFLSTGVTSVSSITPPYLLYAATKGAIEQMTRVVAKDLARKGILVNALAPGPTATELFLRGKSEATLRTVAAFSPFNRIAQPDEMAGTIAFLCGPDTRKNISAEYVRISQ